MKIDILYFDGCPNHPPTADLVRQVAKDRGLPAEAVRETRVESPRDIEHLRFLGSPTVQVDGQDVEPAARSRSDFAYCCRTYGGGGMPPRELIDRAILEALARRSTNATDTQTSAFAAPWLLGGALVAAAAASACCWLPMVLALVGVSAAVQSGMISEYRPALLAGAFGLIGLSIYLNEFRGCGRGRGSGCCPVDPSRRSLRRVLLALGTLCVILLSLIPWYTSTSSPADRSILGPNRLEAKVELSIEGMTCAACAAHLEKELGMVAGVLHARVSYDLSMAEITPRPESPPAMDDLIQAVRRAGYRARIRNP